VEVFVARQPIFNKKEETIAYELLYRDKHDSYYPNIDGDEATTDVIINSFLNIGLETLSCGKPCFINFTENLLKLEIPSYFHPNDIVVEILENVPPSLSIMQYCQRLKEQGYKIALDDFALEAHEKLLPYADIIKVDFLNTSKKKRVAIEQIANRLSIHLLAEKIETREEFEEAKKSGYVYFQGFFFSKPTVISSHDVPTYLHSYFRIIQQLSKPEPDIEEISHLIEQDLSLSYKLLKLANSNVFRAQQKIQSIRHAIMILGLKEIKKWMYILAIREGKQKISKTNDEVYKISLVRAKMCEWIAEKNRRDISASAFLTGMFSLMDSILGIPMDKVLNSLSLDEKISDALRGKDNELKSYLNLVVAMERAEWDQVIEYAKTISIPDKDLPILYSKACMWAENIFKQELQSRKTS